jgi:hypothetical protein
VTRWYVVGKEPAEGDFYVYVYGPFVSESDARAYALDLANDEEGMALIEAIQMEHHAADALATDNVLWPYESEERETDE